MHIYQEKQQEEQRLVGQAQVIVMHQIDFKNVQRRVYDALNVLSALQIISKIRNRVKFIGFRFVEKLSQCSEPAALAKFEEVSPDNQDS